jgi:hypothetical protein
LFLIKIDFIYDFKNFANYCRQKKAANSLLGIRVKGVGRKGKKEQKSSEQQSEGNCFSQRKSVLFLKMLPRYAGKLSRSD